MIGLDQYELIRTRHRRHGMSIREIARECKHSRKTIRNALAGIEPKYRRKKEPQCPVMKDYLDVIRAWLAKEPDEPRKRRLTAREVYRRLVEEYGFQGGESTVRLWVARLKRSMGKGEA
jgi:transposase